jgi:hypothetical protein
MYLIDVGCPSIATTCACDIPILKRSQLDAIFHWFAAAYLSRCVLVWIVEPLS